MVAEYRDKQTLITIVRGKYLSFATFPAPLLSHCPLPLSNVKIFFPSRQQKQKREGGNFFFGLLFFVAKNLTELNIILIIEQIKKKLELNTAFKHF